MTEHEHLRHCFDVTFSTMQLLFIGTRECGGMLIAEDQFVAGKISYAAVEPDGSIIRFGEKIADFDSDVTVHGERLDGPPPFSFEAIRELHSDAVKILEDPKKFVEGIRADAEEMKNEDDSQ